MIGAKSKMASCPSLLLLIALNILATSAKPVINESTSRQGESAQQGQTQNSDQVISDEVKELFGDIYDDYDYKFPSPPAPLTAEELNRPPSPFYDGDYGVDYETPQFQNNFPDTQSRSNSFDSTIINQPFSADRPAVLPPTDLIHPVFDFLEGESEPELPPLVPHPGISQFPEFSRGEDIKLQPGGVSSTHSYNSKEVAQELLLQAQNFNLPIPLEEVDTQEKFSSSQPSFDTNEVFTNGLTAKEAIKYVKEKSRLEKERSRLIVSGSESSDDGIASTDVESSEEQIQQAAEKSKFEFTPVHFPDNEIKQTEELITNDFEFVPESKDEKPEESTIDNLDSIDFKDSQGRASKVASAFKEDKNQSFDENKIQSEGLSIEDAIQYAKLKAEKESGETFISEIEKGLSEKDRAIAQEEINKMILKISDELRSTSSNQPTDSEFYKMLTEAMSKRFIDEYATVKSTSLNTNNLIENTELVQELEIEGGNADLALRHEIVPSIVESRPEGNLDVYKLSESASEVEETQSFDENKVQSEGLEFLEAIKYAKLKAQGKLGNSNSSEIEIRVSDDDKEIAHEEMFKIVLNVLSQAEESESNSPKANDLDYYTMLTDAMTERFIDEHKTENSASVESEVKMNSTATEDQPQEKTIIMAEEIINLFSQINEYQNKKDLNSEEGEFVFIPSVIPGLSEQSSQLKPTPVDVGSTLKEENKKSETPIKEQKLIVEKPNTRRGYDGQISSSVSQTESVERYYPDHQSATSSVRDQNIEAKPVGHDVTVSQTETIERFYPDGQSHTSSLRDYRPEASPIPYHSNGYAYEQQQQQGHIVGAPLTLIQVPQTVERPKGFFRTLAETGSVIKAGAAAFQRKVDIFRTIFKKSYRDHENTDVHLAVVPAYISQVEPNAHPVEVIDYPRSSISTSVDSSVSTSVNFQKLDGPPKGLERINEEEFEKDNFDIKESILEKAAPLLSSELSPPSPPVRPDFDIRSHQEVSAPSQFVRVSHGSQVYGGQGNNAPVMVYSQNPEYHAQEEYTGRRKEHLGFRASDLHDSVNGLYHAARGGYDNVRNSISRFASWFSPSSYSASKDELSTEQVVAPHQVQYQQPLQYQPVYLAVHHPQQQQQQQQKQKTGFLGKLKKKFVPWL